MSNALPWWAGVDDGQFVSVALIQFDLAGHSAWAADQEEKGSRTRAFKARKILAVALRLAAQGYGAELHHWAGDGGLFALRCTDCGDTDRAYEAMAQMYSAFNRWKQEDSTTSYFSCRITGTYIPDVCIGPEAGHWYSSELNSFLKYERQIGFENAICVTNEFRRMLEKHVKRFEGKGRKVALGDGRTITVFADKDHPIIVNQSDTSFGVWLQRNYRRFSVVDGLVPLDGLPSGAIQVSDAVVLAAALSPVGYRLVSLEERTQVRYLGELLTDQDYQVWAGKCAELTRRNVQGTKLRVHSLIPEVLDDPVVRVGWSLGEYRDANAFHSAMATHPDVARRYVQNAMEVLQGGTMLPNSLSNHAIVVFGPPSKRCLLMCHRRKDSRPGSYFRNRWSVSFEEQYNPVEERVGDKVLVRDSSIFGSVERGVREELLGNDYSEMIKVSVHAFLLETMILNFGFLAVVELPDLDFETLKRLWPCAPDAYEHDALVALPLREDLLEQCLLSPRLPESLFHEIQVSRGFDSLGADDHGWHQTSLIRMMLAVWLSQQV